MKTVFIVLILLVFGSCSSSNNYLVLFKDSIDIHVDNQTDGILSNVKVFVVQTILVNGKYQSTRTDSSQIGTIAALKTATGTLYEKNIQGVDGGYLLTATGQNGKLYNHSFGYLTNGSFLDAQQYLIIKKDSILLRR